ncbi:HTTM domain-containing protein [Hymenobacter seoulensis]
MLHLLALLRRPFVLDLRALALLRACVAAILLLDIGIRATDLEAHYSNMGVMPLHVLFQYSWNPYQFSLHNSSGLWQVQAVLFLVQAVVAVALLLGYHARLATFLSWLMLISVQNRNQMILQGGDDLLRMLLFWGFFLPWGRVYSLDARSRPAPSSYSYFSAATVAYMVQLALVYWCAAMLKSGPEWRIDGTALYYALSLDQILMPGGRLIYPYPELLRFLTFASFYTELLIPFALFIPFRVPWWRWVFIGVIIGFHIGISLTLFVGLFFLINIVSVMGLWPAASMNWLEQRLVPPVQRLVARLAPIWAKVALWRGTTTIQLQTAVEVSSGLRRLLRALRDGLVVGVLLYVCWWNLDSIVSPRWTMQQPLRWLGYLVRVDQHWGMFAPTVFKDDGWYILDGTTEDGRHLDLNRNGAPTSYQKPASVVSLFKNDRWRKYAENYLFVSNGYMRPYYCNYLRRIWEEDPSHPRLRQLDVVYMKEVTQPDYRTVRPTKEVLCSCAPEAPATADEATDAEAEDDTSSENK